MRSRLLSEIATELSARYTAPAKDIVIRGVNDLALAQVGEISFLSSARYEKHLYETEASAVLVQTNFQPKKACQALLLRVPHVQSSLSRVLPYFQKDNPSAKVGKEKPVYIADSAQIGQEPYIGAFAYIGDGARIGNRVKLFPHVYVGDHVVIEDDTIIFPGAVIHSHTHIGKRCLIESGAVIGGMGFGYTREKEGAYQAIPQIGSVVIEDNVRIGSNSCIDRATFATTHIKKGAKLDNLIQIGHNVRLGEHVIISALTGIAGSCKIGNEVRMGGFVGLKDHLTIADKVDIGASSKLMRDIKKKGSAVFGTPAEPIHNYFKSIAYLRKLPELAQQLTLLKKELEAVKNQFIKQKNTNRLDGAQAAND